jgi:hypothetical protein
VNKEEIIYSAIEAMKEQDAFLDQVPPQSTPRIMMSIETYEQMQKDPEKAKDICGRILGTEDSDKKDIKDLSEYIKKW